VEEDADHLALLDVGQAELHQARIGVGKVLQTVARSINRVMSRCHQTARDAPSCP
jgi:hypothetical protein